MLATASRVGSARKTRRVLQANSPADLKQASKKTGQTEPSQTS